MENNCRVMIVDDEIIMRKGLRHLLDWDSHGFSIVGEAANGSEALEMLPKIKPHIVIADIVMPVLNGVEFSAYLSKHYPEIKLIILSSHTDFQYVKGTLMNNAFDYLLKPSLKPQALLETLKRAASNIKDLTLKAGVGASCETILNRYILGYEDSLPLEALGTVFVKDSFLFFGVSLKPLENKREKLRKALTRELGYELSNYTIIHLSLHEDIEVCLINFSITGEVELKVKLNAIGERLNRMMDGGLFIRSKAFSEIKESRIVYKTFFLPEAEGYFYHKGMGFKEASSKGIKEEGMSLKFHRRGFLKLIDSLRYIEAYRYFTAFLQEILAKEEPEEMELKSLVVNTLYEIFSALEEAKLCSRELKQEYIPKVQRAPYKEDLQELLQEIDSRLQDLLATDKDKVRNTVIIKIMDYINENYAENLELSDLAERFSFSYNYLSSYFNLNFKEGFSDYLNQVRIERAKELLLKKGHLSIGDVGSMVGYSNTSYFCRVFKKYTAMTPGRFKKLHGGR